MRQPRHQQPTRGGDGTDIGAFEVQASCGPEQSLQTLLDMVNSLVKRPQPLRATLLAAGDSLQRHDAASAVRQIGAFENQVRAQIAPADLALAGLLLDRAEALLNQLR
jgi:hypothetical protein